MSAVSTRTTTGKIRKKNKNEKRLCIKNNNDGNSQVDGCGRGDGYDVDGYYYYSLGKITRTFVLQSRRRSVYSKY